MRTTGFVIGAMLLVLLGATFASMLFVLNDHGILMSRGYTSGMTDSMMGDMMSGSSSMMNGTASGMMGSMMSGSVVTNTTGMMNGTMGSMMNGAPNGMMRGYASLMSRMMVRSTIPMFGLSAMQFMLWPALLVLIVVGGGLLAWLALARQPQSVPAAAQSVLDILNLRYAKGEINKEQFEEMRHSLKP